MIVMEDKDRRWSGRLRLNPKAPLVTPSRLHNHPVDEELRLLKKEASLWENEQQRVLGGEGWGSRHHARRSVGRSVGKSNDCNLEIDLHIYGASKPSKQASAHSDLAFRAEGREITLPAVPCRVRYL